jgi:hypothetical protein
MIVPLMAAELFEVRSLGRLLGAILTADGIVEALAPCIVGRKRNVPGTYSGGFLILMAMALLGATAVAALPKRSVQA